MNNNPQAEIRIRGLVMLLKSAISILISALALFLSAGTLRWGLAWVLMGLVTANLIVNTALIDPELRAERAGVTQGAKRWDLPLVLLMARIGPLALMVVAGLDRRHGWTAVEIDPLVSCVALGVGVLGMVLSDWAMAANRFFAPLVRIQSERGHHVVSAGPYRWLRHPGYAGSNLFFLVEPLILTSLWAFVPAACVVVVTVVRTALEDRTLQQELPGYAEYARRVRYRLVPGIW